MQIKIVLTGLVLAFLALPAFAQKTADKRLLGIDTLVRSILEEWHAPGAGICVVEKNKVIFAGGFGFRDLKKKLPVTEYTQFAIGSCTKAFTAALLGILQKEGKLDLDRPVINYLPQLRFKNEYTTNHVTLRDMMCHRTGLPRHDMSWYGSNASRDELLERIRFLEPTSEVRQNFQYNNLMFMVQGIVIEKLTGKSWEENMKQRMLIPLGMTHSSLSVTEMAQSDDHSLAYGLKKDSISVPIPYRNIDAIGPAGSINSCSRDMAQWLMTWIYGGKFRDSEIIPQSYVKQAIIPQMTTGGGFPGKEFPDLHLSGYGLGWGISSYRGHYRVEHGGGIDGFISSVAFFPTDSIGIFVVTNQGGPTSAIRNILADRMLNLPFRDWNRYLLNAVATEKKQKALAEGTDSVHRIPNTSPSHPLLAYTGTYIDSGYGKIEFSLKNDTLYGRFNSFNIRLNHYHYDQFRGIYQEENMQDMESLKINFITGERGDIEKVNIPFQAGAKDITFEKSKKSPQLSDVDLLKYTGEYILGAQKIEIMIRNQKELWAHINGQPDYLLEPSGKDEFNFKTLKGYSVRFEPDDSGKIIAAYFIQPNGTFKSTRSK